MQAEQATRVSHQIPRLGYTVSKAVFPSHYIHLISSEHEMRSDEVSGVNAS